MYCCAATLLHHYSNKWLQEYLFQIKGLARNPRYFCANSLVKQSYGEHHNCRACWYFADNAQYSPFTLAFNTRKCTHTHSYYEEWVFNNCILLYIVRHSVMHFFFLNVTFLKKRCTGPLASFQGTWHGFGIEAGGSCSQVKTIKKRQLPGCALTIKEHAET